VDLDPISAEYEFHYSIPSLQAYIIGKISKPGPGSNFGRLKVDPGPVWQTKDGPRSSLGRLKVDPGPVLAD